MTNNNLYMQIKEFQRNNMEIFPQIFSQFERLIYTYSARIDYEDAFQELTVFLVELLYKIDLKRLKDSIDLKKYIAVSIRNKYIHISRERQKLLLEQNQYFEMGIEYFDPAVKEILKSAIKNLSKNQQKTIIYKYIYCYSDAEIADELEITRQAVNRTKNRALNSLRAYFEEEI